MGGVVDDKDVKTFMTLAGQQVQPLFIETCGSRPTATDQLRKLGARLLLSEVLEYVIKGLGVAPVINGVRIEDADSLTYEIFSEKEDQLEMVDGLADVAYTMFWNALALGVPLEEGFDAVCKNNLEKFIPVDEVLPHNIESGSRLLPKSLWHLEKGITWPSDVARVELLLVDSKWYAVGKDVHGKVRKPSSYRSVNLQHLVSANG